MEERTFRTVNTPLKSVKEIEEDKPLIQNKPLRSEKEKERIKNEKRAILGASSEARTKRKEKFRQTAEDYLRRVLEDEY